MNKQLPPTDIELDNLGERVWEVIDRATREGRSETRELGRFFHDLEMRSKISDDISLDETHGFDYRCDCCDNGLQAEWDFCPWCGKIQREEPSGLCLAGLATNKVCRPDDTLKRCTICDRQWGTKLNAASICAAAAALFGPNWTKPELAYALDWDLRNVQRFCSGQLPIDPRAQSRLMALLHARHVILTTMLDELEDA